VFILDTGILFSREGIPNDETTAGAFFDLLADSPTKTKLFVRTITSRIDDPVKTPLQKIRGSGQFADVRFTVGIAPTDKSDE